MVKDIDVNRLTDQPPHLIPSTPEPYHRNLHHLIILPQHST